MKLVYVAGPFRAENAWLIELNIRAAEWQGYKIALLGAVPIIPHTMYRFFNGTRNDSFWLQATQDLLARCDAIYMVDGWKRSEGSHAEKALADMQKIPVFKNDQNLKEWINATKEEG